MGAVARIIASMIPWIASISPKMAQAARVYTRRHYTRPISRSLASVYRRIDPPDRTNTIVSRTGGPSQPNPLSGSPRQPEPSLWSRLIGAMGDLTNALVRRTKPLVTAAAPYTRPIGNMLQRQFPQVRQFSPEWQRRVQATQGRYQRFVRARISRLSNQSLQHAGRYAGTAARSLVAGNVGNAVRGAGSAIGAVARPVLLAAYSNPVTAAIATVAIAITGLAIGAVVATRAIHSMANSMVESRRQFAQFNGQLAAAYGRLDVQRIQRNIRFAQAIAPSTSSLVRSLSRLEDRLLPLVAGIAATTASGVEALVRLVDLSFQWSPGLQILSDISERVLGIRKNTDKAGDGTLGATARFLRDNLPDGRKRPPLKDEDPPRRRTIFG